MIEIINLTTKLYVEAGNLLILKASSLATLALPLNQRQ